MWILATALNNTMTAVESGDIDGTGCEELPGSLVPLQNFSYGDVKMACLIQWNLQQTNFSGVSVRMCTILLKLMNLLQIMYCFASCWCYIFFGLLLFLQIKFFLFSFRIESSLMKMALGFITQSDYANIASMVK
jgi:hypothetical protein